MWCTHEHTRAHTTHMTQLQCCASGAVSFSIVCFLSRVFRTMFKQFKPSSAANRLSSPLLRRRIPTVSHQYMSPQNSRKSRIPGIGRMKKKRSVPEGLASLDPSAMPATPFCEDPGNMQIKEQVNMTENLSMMYM